MTMDVFSYDRVLYVDRGVGALDVLDAEDGHRVVFGLPADAAELRDPADVVEEVSNALSKALVDMRVSSAVMHAIGKVLKEQGAEDVSWWLAS